MICLFIFTNHLFTQNIHLSNKLGDINKKFTYGKLKKILGKPDSTYSFDPKNRHPMPKSLAYNQFFYDNKHFEVSFYYFMMDTLTKKSANPYIMMYKGCSIKLNDDLIDNLDSAYIVNKYGKPESTSSSNEELVISYNFVEEKYFSLLLFYFNAQRRINKVRICFGKY
ncbi:MAG: hypothetical protein U0U67_15555 [Chitinophagales bacterium]